MEQIAKWIALRLRTFGSADDEWGCTLKEPLESHLEAPFLHESWARDSNLPANDPDNTGNLSWKSILARVLKVIIGAVAFFCMCILFALISTLLLACVFILMLLVRTVNLMRCRRQEPIALNLAACSFYEDQWVQNGVHAFPSSTRSEWIDSAEGIKTHHLIVPRDLGHLHDRDTSSADMVMLHGTGSSSSLAWSSCAKSLAKHFKIYALDLPAFGRSTMPWQLFSGASHPELEDLYADWLANYINSLGLYKPIVVATSLGGFFAIKFAKKYPSQLSKLILVDPAGVYPTLGAEGYYFALFFKLGIPMRQLRFIGRLASLLSYAFFDFRNAGSKAYYWLQLNASPTAFGDRVVSKFITVSSNGLSAYWNRPAISDLLTAGVPIAFVYGEIDNLMPFVQGQVVQELMNCGRTLELVSIVPGAWHMPFHIDNGAPFVEKLLRAVRVACVPRPCRTLVNRLETLSPASYSSTTSFKTTAKTIECLYADLRT